MDSIEKLLVLEFDVVMNNKKFVMVKNLFVKEKGVWVEFVGDLKEECFKRRDVVVELEFFKELLKVKVVLVGKWLNLVN